MATVAFGIGLDSPNVREVIHWGPPEDLELYVQETGRGGCDNLPSNALLYYGKRDLSQCGHCTDGMKRYCENNSECRRKVLMKQFTDKDHSQRGNITLSCTFDVRCIRPCNSTCRCGVVYRIDRQDYCKHSRKQFTNTM